MKVQKKNLTRFASLSALTAGALAVAPGDAQAAVIYTALPNPVVGPDGVASYSINLPGTAVLSATFQHFTVTSIGQRWAAYLRQGAGTVAIKDVDVTTTNIEHVLIVDAGKNWGTGVPGAADATVGVASRVTSYGSGFFYGNGPFDHKYALFSFDNGGTTNYGWLELSLAVDPATGPNVTLEGWAYEDSGRFINAGDTTGAGAVPEPSSFALLGLGALALGATGVRRWRKARKAA